MTKKHAINFLNDVYDDLKEDFPNLKKDTCRDGKSSALVFKIPSEQCDTIVLYAPITRLVDGSNTILRIERIDIIKDGCAKMDDCQKESNVFGTVCIEHVSVLLALKVKKEIAALVRKRLEIQSSEI